VRTSFDKGVQVSMREIQGEYDGSTKEVQTLYSPRTPSAVSHIPHFGDAASPAGDVDVSAGDAHL
jgi:hypothetical protein